MSTTFRSITPPLPSLNLQRIASSPSLGVGERALSPTASLRRPSSTATLLFSPRSESPQDENVKDINNPDHMPYFSFKDLRDHYFTLKPNSLMAKKIELIIKRQLCILAPTTEDKLGVTLENIFKSELSFVTLFKKFNNDSVALSTAFDDIFDDAEKIPMDSDEYNPLCFFVVENNKRNGLSIIKIADSLYLEEENRAALSLEHFEVYDLVTIDKKTNFRTSFLSPYLIRENLKLSPYLKEVINEAELIMAVPISEAVTLFLENPSINKVLGRKTGQKSLKKLDLNLKQIVIQSIVDPYNFLPISLRTRKTISNLFDSENFRDLFANLYQSLIAHNYIQNSIKTTAIPDLVNSESDSNDPVAIRHLYEGLENFFYAPLGKFLESIHLVTKELDATIQNILLQTTSKRIKDKPYLLYMTLGLSWISMASTYAFGHHNPSTNVNESVAYLRFLTAYCITQFIRLRTALPLTHKDYIGQQETLLLQALALECVVTDKCAGEIAGHDYFIYTLYPKSLLPILMKVTSLTNNIALIKV